MIERFMGCYSTLKAIPVPVDSNWDVSVPNMLAAYNQATEQGKKVSAVVVVNPNNPTGSMYGRELMLEVMQFAKERDMHVIVDEIYFLSTYEGKFDSILSYSRQWPDPLRTHFLWGFSKDMSLSGGRCGVIVSKNPDIHTMFAKSIAFMHFVPGIIQMKLCNVLKDKVWVDEMLDSSRSRLRANSQIVMETLDKLELTYLRPRGCLFMWVDFSKLFKSLPPTREEAETIFNRIIDYKIYISWGAGFNAPKPEFFRIVYAVPRENIALAMQRFEKFVAEY